MTCFSDDYSAARARFRAAAAGRGLALGAEPIGAAGLAIDIAVGGSAGPRALLSISGTHGQEAFAGAAAQVAFLEAGWDGIPAGTRLVFVHALNPWGFAHGHRGNADNVDLSRNFIDFAETPRPASPHYRRLHAIGARKSWSDETTDALRMEVRRLIAEVGAEAAMTALTGGQYEFPDGINYGGVAPAPERLAFEAVCRRELTGVSRLCVLDWHTGFGAFGEPFFVCPFPPGSAALERTRAWFEHASIGRSGDAFSTGTAPRWRGLLLDGLRRARPDLTMAGAIVEIGTYPDALVGEALRIDRWLRFGDGAQDERARLRAVMMERLNPSASAWRAAVERIGIDMHRRAVRGLSSWDGV